MFYKRGIYLNAYHDSLFGGSKMKASIGVVVFFLIMGCSVLAETSAEVDSLQLAERIGAEGFVIIDSTAMLVECLESVQWQYLPVSLPSLSERLLQPAGSFPADFSSFDPALRKSLLGHGLSI